MTDNGNKIAYRRTLRALLGVALVLLLTPAASPAGQLAHEAEASSPSRHLLANGLDVTLYSADLLGARLTVKDGAPAIPLDGVRYLSVITDINDAAITNKGDGAFHPFDEKHVLETLSRVSHPRLNLPVTVYLLPYPRRSVLVSSTSGLDIFLSPHVLDIDPSVSAYIVTHELGHVFHNAHLPDGTTGWSEYRRVRGINDVTVFSESATHAYRPKEIFAEDFRVLFGGDEAAWGGQIENTALTTPVLVDGLESFMYDLGVGRVYTRAAVIASNYPNPFNPDTQISITVPDDVLRAAGRVSVRIYDVRGALVRDLYSGVPTDSRLVLGWDGTDRSGNTVATSQYFAQIRAGEYRTTLKLVMLK